MVEIASQIVICLVAAAFIGFLIGLIIGKALSSNDNGINNATAVVHVGAQSNVYNKPLIRSSPRPSGKDDLKQIEGISRDLEIKLNSLGIFHFDQIAKWSNKNSKWVEVYLEVETNIIKEGKWVEQARSLSKFIC